MSGCTKLHIAPRAEPMYGTSKAEPQKFTFAIFVDPESVEREASSAVKASPESTEQTLSGLKETFQRETAE